LGWATITHPFHPLRGKRYEILFCRTLNNQDIFSLKDPNLEISAILREWTDRADPDPYQFLSSSPPVLSFIHLLQLSDLLEAFQQNKLKKKLKD